MEDILKEILYELKKINHILDKNTGLKEVLENIADSNSYKVITVTIGEDVICENVIDNINKENRISGKTVITI
ncbi:hypothetical protein CIW83_18445 [Tissierella sp. P1]|uniref:hypothetical protein n=1 Tax=Tissierella sp. P1 TaxID=1280483 RepID=UPI000BA00E38|nr:hypothetical protein [Tissierella sp. P1]OZV10798.1 hypothetical protein CIW83_18445 [Tissierella sp. P1]